MTKKNESNKINAQDISKEKPSTFNLILQCEANKLNPKINSKIFFDILINDKEEIFIKLTANESGGLFSKEAIPLNKIFELLDNIENDKPFKSNVFKSVFKGGSANNTGFLAATLRSKDIGLIVQAPKSIFSHVKASNYNERKKALLCIGEGMKKTTEPVKS